MKKEKLTYPKALSHGKINKLFENVWFVQDTVKMPMLVPMKISHSMTVVRNADNKDPVVNKLNSARKTL